LLSKILAVREDEKALSKDVVKFGAGVFVDMPDEIFVKILEYLETKHLCIEVQLVNKRFNTLLEQEYMKKVLMRRELFPPESRGQDSKLFDPYFATLDTKDIFKILLNQNIRKSWEFVVRLINGLEEKSVILHERSEESLCKKTEIFELLARLADNPILKKIIQKPISKCSLDIYELGKGFMIKGGNLGFGMKQQKATLYKGSFINNKKSGEGDEYDEKGILRYEGKFIGGKKWGQGKEYDENGALRYEGGFNCGEKWGQGKEYDENRVLRYEGEGRNSETRSEGKEYDKKGRLIYWGIFKSNKKIDSGKGRYDNEKGKPISDRGNNGTKSGERAIERVSSKAASTNKVKGFMVFVGKSIKKTIDLLDVVEDKMRERKKQSEKQKVKPRTIAEAYRNNTKKLKKGRVFKLNPKNAVEI
jgi:antitoxin component YwqK of YwqJK toxin-antitoxin module